MTFLQSLPVRKTIPVRGSRTMTLREAFKKAVNNPANRFDIVDGFHEKSDEQLHDINWNFVDADCAFETLELPYHGIEGTFEGKTYSNACEAYYDKFDAMCDEYEENLARVSPVYEENRFSPKNTWGH